MHLPGAGNRNEFCVCRRLKGGRTGNQGDFRAAERSGASQCVSHLSGGVVGDVPHRIDGFLRRTGGDQDPFPGKILVAGQQVQDFFQQRLRFRHFTRAGITAGQVAVGRIHNVESVLPKNRHIVLSNRILIHGSVHGRRHQLRTLRRQKNGGEHIVGQAVSRLCHKVGGGRRHTDQVRGFRQRDVLHIVFEISVKGVHRNPVVGQGFKGEGRDEPSGVLGHDDVHIGMLLLQSAGQHGTLICCDAAGDAQQHGFSL